MKLTEENLNGKIFNRWKILNFHEKRKNAKYYWCECLDCHKIKSVCVQTVISGKSKSCGCISRKENAYNINKKENKIKIENDIAYILIENAVKAIMICDTEDLDKLKGLYIRNHLQHGNLYAISTRDYKKIIIHRYILNITDSKIQVDHINHNTLDNRKINLRLCNNQENNFNKIKLNSNNTSGYRGVTWDNERQKWAANLCHNSKTYHKRFDSPEEAYEWYIQKNKKIFGEFSGYANQEILDEQNSKLNINVLNNEEIIDEMFAVITDEAK